METILIKIAQVVAAFAILIILHEGGHFLFAKLFKIRVEKFYLFFDAWDIRLFRWPRKKKSPDQTEYGIGWLPLGGYVKIAGMIDESMDTQQMKQEPQPWEFRTKPAWQRLLVMLGGVIVNFITAFVIYMGILFIWGNSYIRPTDMTYGLKFNEEAISHGFRNGDIICKTDDKVIKEWDGNVLRDIANADEVTILRENREVTLKMPAKQNMLEMATSNPPYAQMLLPLQIDSILPESPAQQAGLHKGDVITQINDTPIDDFNDLAYQLSVFATSLNQESTAADSLRLRTITLVVNHADTLHAVLTPDFTLGFVNKSLDYKVTTDHYNILQSIPAGFKYGWEQLGNYVNDLKYLFTAQGAKSVSGIVGITNIFPDTWDWQRFWRLTALLSIALGVMNVLPIPALDGGHAIFAIYEIITRRKPSEKVLIRAQYIGFILLIALMIFATWNDIVRILGL